MTPLVAGFSAGAAAWLTQGSIALTGGDAGRIGLLPLAAPSLALASVAAALVWWLVRRGAGALPLSLLALPALPWLPMPLPPALLLWTGPMALLVWVAIALCMLRPVPVRFTPAIRPQVAAGAAALLLAIVAFWQVSPSVPGGDEPHYLVITQSLLKDGDIRIENNHRQRDYRSYWSGDLAPDFRVRGRNREIYSIHAPGVSVLVAPAFALAGYHGAIAFLLVLSSMTAALAWHLAWRMTCRADAAWFGWASVALSTTFLFHTFTVYPDGPGAFLTLTGVWALVRAEQEKETGSESTWPWWLHGVALAAMPWMHTRFAVLAGGLGALILLRLGGTPNALSKAGALLAVPALSAVCWIGYFMSIYGAPDPSAPYGGEPGSFAFVPDGLAGLLFDQRFGLLMYAPVLLFAFAGIGVMLTRPGWRRHAAELLFVLLPYLLVVTYVAMWWGGTSAPARFFVPVLPWMAIPAAAAWAAITRRSDRVVAIGALAFTLFASAVLVFAEDGRLAFNVRETHARWLEWLNGSVDLARGLPAWWRDRETPLFRGMAIWGAAAGAGWFALRRLDGVGALRPAARFATAATLVCAGAASMAFSLAWAAERVDGRAAAPGQLQALRRISTEPRLLALDLSRARRVAAHEVPEMMTIDPGFSTAPGGAGRNDRPLFAAGAIPAGEYRLRFSLRAASGWVMIGIGRDQFALITSPLSAAYEPLAVSFPVDVRALLVRVDEDARRNVTGMTIEPTRLVPPSSRLVDGYARRAVHYPGAIAYFLDDRSFPEPEAFWVAGARDASVVLQPDQPRATARFHLRNGAAGNDVVVQSGGWRDGFRLGPGEERQLDVPLDQARGATLLRFTTSAGFRPSEVDPRSRDDRFLGLWVKVLN